MISSTQLLGSPKTIRFSASRSIVSRPGGRLTIGWGHRKYILSNGSGNSPRSLRPVAQPLYARGDAGAVLLMWFFHAEYTLCVCGAHFASALLPTTIQRTSIIWRRSNPLRMRLQLWDWLPNLSGWIPMRWIMLPRKLG